MKRLQLLEGVNRPYTIIGWLMIVGGIAALVGGWVGVQSTPVVAVQLTYLASGSLVGIALVVAGASFQSQDDLKVLREIVEELRDRFDDLEDATLRIDARTTPAEPVAQMSPARKSASSTKVRAAR